MNNNKKIILFCAYGGGHAQIIYPVIKALINSHIYISQKIDYVFLSPPASINFCKEKNLNYLTYKDFIDKEKDKLAFEYGEILSKTNHSKELKVHISESKAYLGLCYQDLIHRFGKKEAEKRFAKKNRHAFLPISIMERVVDYLNPVYIVTTNSPKTEAALIEVSNRKKIENLIITDLFSGLPGYFLKAKNISFLNKFSRDLFSKNKFVDKKISKFHITGNPTFDKFKHFRREKNKSWIEKNFQKPLRKKIILHADMPSYVDSENNILKIRDLKEIKDEMEICYNACIKNDCIYIVRPHPTQDKYFYQEWVEDKKYAFYGGSQDLHELIVNIDLLVARTTTVALEAIYLRKKVLQIDSNYHKDYPLTKMGVAWESKLHNNFSHSMSLALKKDERHRNIMLKIEKLFPFENSAIKILQVIFKDL